MDDMNMIEQETTAEETEAVAQDAGEVKPEWPDAGDGGVVCDAEGNVIDYGIAGPPGDIGAECDDAWPVKIKLETTLVQDVVRAIRNQLERDQELNGESYHSAFESYGILNRALEDKHAVEKDLKKHMGDLWDGVKREDDDVTCAYLSDIERVARESAMAWIRVAAIAKKAVDSL